MEPDTRGIACCFDEESRQMLEDFREKGLGATAKMLLSVLRSQGLAGMSSLELGCGVGALTLGLFKEGVASAIGMDLSPKMIEAARSMTADEGLSGSVSFEVGDGARANLTGADIVVLDTVLCCYPDVAVLVDNSSSAARRYYAISLPDDRRLATRIIRPFLPLQSVFMRRGTFRFFIHSKARVVGQLERKGFRRIYESAAGRIWSVLVFAAPSPS